MTRAVVLPGSTGEAESPVHSGRLTPEDAATLAQVAAWWRNRLTRDPAPDPLASLIGGADNRGAAQTVGTTPATVAFAPALALPAGGLSLWAQALGIPAGPADGPYALVGLCHFHGATARYVTVARLPATAATLELRATFDAAGAPVVQLVGAAGVSIEWTVDAYLLEGE